MKVGFLPAADVEFRATASYFESRVEGLGEEFIAEVEHTRAALRASSSWCEIGLRAQAPCAAEVPVRIDLPSRCL